MLSVSYGTQYLKLKTNLRLAINRLKMAQKKKTEMSIKARVEIADLLSAGKVDRARIRVEHIIREDFIVEGYEILELYCDLLLARFGILEHKTEIDESIGEAVVSILWAVPRIRAEISEFKVVGDQLQIKYGKGLVQAAVNNKIESPVVSPRLIEKMSITAPKKLHVEKRGSRYLIEIANKFGIKFKADPEIIQEDEVSLAEKMLIDFCGTANCSAPPPETRPEIGWATCPALHQFHNPNHPSVLNSSIFSPPAPSIKPADSRKHSVTPDDLPLPPMPSPPQAKPELDFDDLMKRFDALKKRN